MRHLIPPRSLVSSVIGHNRLTRAATCRPSGDKIKADVLGTAGRLGARFTGPGGAVRQDARLENLAGLIELRRAGRPKAAASAGAARRIL